MAIKFAKIIGGILGLIMLLTVSGGFFINRTQTATATRIFDVNDSLLFTQISNLHQWENWHEWNTMNDSSLRYIYSGNATGKGAERNWTSNNYSNGKLRIIAADSNRLDYELEVGDLKNINGTILLTRIDNATQLTWTQTMHCRWNPYLRYMFRALKKISEEEMNRSLVSLQRHIETQK
jgi:hypothetical protein